MKTTDIYQRIYDADIFRGSGVPAVVRGEATDDQVGYIVVTESRDASKVEDVLHEVVIPPSKQKSYQLAEALFDNYDLVSSVPDDITYQEASEVDDLLDHIINREPMHIAREYISSRSGRQLSDAAWYALVKETWFRPFRVGSSPTRSGFEHVFLGELKAGSNTVGGLHWWYFYLTKMDKIDYRGAIYENSDKLSGLIIPEIATMSFVWNVAGRTILKKIGGFFVGLSAEGLMAMGMVRSSSEAGAPNIAEIQGAEIEMKLFKSPDGRSVNTFYPVMRRVLLTRPGPGNGTNPPAPAAPTTPVSPNRVETPRYGSLRIISAVVNPDGIDEGREKITIMNALNGDVLNLNGWKVVGPNQSAIVFGDVWLNPGDAKTFTIPARGSLQLSNKGGIIQIFDPSGVRSHRVDYDRTTAGVQGAILIWDGMSSLIQAGSSSSI